MIDNTVQCYIQIRSIPMTATACADGPANNDEAA